MTYEETKKALDSLRQKKRLLKKQEEQIRQARGQIDCLKATDYSKIAVQGGNKEFIAEVFVEHMERLQTGYEELLSEVFEIEDYISEHTKDLTEIERSIIIDRYMLGKPWKRIQQDYNYAERQPYRIEGSAIKKLSEKMKDDSK